MLSIPSIISNSVSVINDAHACIDSIQLKSNKDSSTPNYSHPRFLKYNIGIIVDTAIITSTTG